jgi:hypothetical protein
VHLAGERAVYAAVAAAGVRYGERCGGCGRRRGCAAAEPPVLDGCRKEEEAAAVHVASTAHEFETIGN